MLEFGCKWTWEYFFTGLAGSFVATVILPGSYTTIPYLRRCKAGELSLHWGALARLLVGGIAGCVVDCNPRNAFFGGFFSWHFFRWLSEDGWRVIEQRIKALFGKKGD